LAARLSKTAQSLPGAADAAPYEWIVVAPDAGGSGRAGTAGFSKELGRAIAAAGGRVVAAPTGTDTAGRFNAALAQARGEFIARVWPGDRLAPCGLGAVAKAAADNPEADVLYTDEILRYKPKAAADRKEWHPNQRIRKPVWSPLRLRCQDYFRDLTVMRTALVRDIGGWRSRYPGAEDYDLYLRLSRRARGIVHVAEPVYRRLVERDLASRVWRARVAAAQEHCDILGVPAEATRGEFPGIVSYRYWLNEPMKVSVVIPTRGDHAVIWGFDRVMVVDCVRSLVQRGGHGDLEIVVVYDADMAQSTLDALRAAAGPALRLVEYSEPFNFSRKCNVGARAATGDVIVLMNDDMEIKTDGFLTQLVAPLQLDGVGATGARLLFEDQTLQHAGVQLARGFYAQQMRLKPTSFRGPLDAAHVSREVSSLTGACIALRRDLYEQVGGLDEGMPVNFNDTDFTLKISRTGQRLIWLAEPTCYHFESKSRVNTVHQWERALLRRRWQDVLSDYDPYYPQHHAAYPAPDARTAAGR
jgi:GT2 family glycosyltransferase